jgi:hypothetical protein
MRVGRVHTSAKFGVHDTWLKVGVTSKFFKESGLRIWAWSGKIILKYLLRRMPILQCSGHRWCRILNIFLLWISRNLGPPWQVSFFKKQSPVANKGVVPWLVETEAFHRNNKASRLKISIIRNGNTRYGAHGGAVGWGTALQTGRSRVRFRWCHWDFLFT